MSFQMRQLDGSEVMRLAGLLSIDMQEMTVSVQLQN
jgi:hypothetical protein